jgi:8-oxo-dGTP diphosphatase
LILFYLKQALGFELLDKKFPFLDMKKLYTTLLGREIDRQKILV